MASRTKESWTWLASLFFAAAAESAAAGARGTEWQLTNRLPDPVSFECQAERLAGTGAAAAMNMRVSERADATYVWGDSWHNDGMGLNAGDWTCRVTRVKDRATTSIQFATEWGEALALEARAEGAGLLVRRILPVSDVSARLPGHKARSARH